MTHMFDATPIPPGTVVNVSRRFMLKGVVATGTLVLGTSLLPGRAMADWATGAGAMPGGTVNDPHVFISIDPSGLVTIIASRSEMGTGVRTSLPMVVADEMEADWSRVHVQQAPGDEKKYGNQDTDGSRSTRHFLQPMRQCGAAMRTMLEQAAAKRWGVDPSTVKADNHVVVHVASGRKADFGELAAAAAALPTPPVSETPAEGSERVPLHRHRHDLDRRSARYHHGACPLRYRRQDSGDEIRGRGAAAGRGRQARLVRCD